MAPFMWLDAEAPSRLRGDLSCLTWLARVSMTWSLAIHICCYCNTSRAETSTWKARGGGISQRVAAYRIRQVTFTAPSMVGQRSVEGVWRRLSHSCSEGWQPTVRPHD